MSEQALQDFIAKIETALIKNGYPNNRVALPLERMYESAYEKGLNFNKALDLLAQRGIAHEKTSEKLIFFPAPSTPDIINDEDPISAFGKMDPSAFQGINFNEMMAKATELLKNMSPDQMAQMQKMVADMTPEQREEMLKKAKDFGLSR